jgi:hypothetical protein
MVEINTVNGNLSGSVSDSGLDVQAVLKFMNSQLAGEYSSIVDCNYPFIAINKGYGGKGARV